MEPSVHPVQQVCDYDKCIFSSIFTFVKIEKYIFCYYLILDRTAGLPLKVCQSTVETGSRQTEINRIKDNNFANEKIIN